MGLRISNGFFKISNGVFRSIEPLISSGGGPLVYNITELLTTTGLGSWPKPEGVTEITVECWGGGGAGGGAILNPGAGAGGAGGQYARKKVTYASFFSNIVYSVGAGGVASQGNGLSGSSTTWAVDQVIAVGGAGGLANAGLDQQVPGGEGSLDGGIGDIVYKGGNAGPGQSFGPAVNLAFSGAGGGGAGSTGNGGNAISLEGGIGTSEFGGTGGNGFSTALTSQNGNPGSNYGGGGSGGATFQAQNCNGGAGAQGLIRVSYQVQPPLQTYTGSNAAYSIRQLSTEATASMQVQRSSDDAVLDIGFQADGMLDTGSLTTFVGANTGYVKFWYDQTGGGHHLERFNVSVAQWPIIVSSGSLVTTNGKPALRFNAGQTMLIVTADQSYTTGGGEWFQFAVAQSADATTRLLTKIGNSVEIAQAMRRSATALESIGYNTVGGTGTDSNGVSPGTAQFIAYSQRTTSGVEIYMNGTSNGETAVAGTPRTEALSTIVIGSFNPASLTFPWSGSVQEVIHYPQTPATFTYRTGLTAELNSYYGTF